MADWIHSLTPQFIFAAQMLGTSVIYSVYLERRNLFWFRFLVGVAIYLSLVWLLPDLITKNGFALIPIIVYGAFTVLGYFVFAMDLKMTCFFAMSTVATQHLAVAVTDGLGYLFSLSQGSIWWDSLCWVCFAVVLGDCYLLFGSLMQYIMQVRMRTVKFISISAIIFAVVYVLRFFSVERFSTLPKGDPLLVTLNLYSAVGSFACLFVLYASNHEDTLVEEKQLIEQLLREREAQQKFSKETIDLINIKCHDMKHQIHLLRSNPSMAVDEGALQEMEKAATLYDSFAQTGNEVLDAVLTEKGLYCEGKKICFNYMVDGKNLGFLQSSDICSLFGNILENAIEAELAELESKRIISLQVFRKRAYLCIHAENYCEIPPKLDHGIPVTKKENKQYHGFGIKSIQYIAQKYGGNVTISTQNHFFCIDILLPIPGSASTDSF